VDAMDQVRIAGAIVDILTAMGCSAEDMGAIADAIHRHLVVQEKETLPVDTNQKSSLVGLNN